MSNSDIDSTAGAEAPGIDNGTEVNEMVENFRQLNLPDDGMLPSEDFTFPAHCLHSVREWMVNGNIWFANHGTDVGLLWDQLDSRAAGPNQGAPYFYEHQRDSVRSSVLALRRLEAYVDEHPDTPIHFKRPQNGEAEHPSFIIEPYESRPNRYAVPAFMIVLPPRTGKTRIMWTLAAFSRHKVLIVVPNNCIREQIADDFLDLISHLQLPKDTWCSYVKIIHPDPPTRSDDQSFNLMFVKRLGTSMSAIRDAKVLIMTYQGLAAGENLRDVASLFGPSLVLMDESHHTTSDTYVNIRETFLNIPTVYVTATPIRHDSDVLNAFPVYARTLDWAIRHGFVKNPITLTKIHTRTIKAIQNNARWYFVGDRWCRRNPNNDDLEEINTNGTGADDDNDDAHNEEAVTNPEADQLDEPVANTDNGNQKERLPLRQVIALAINNQRIVKDWVFSALDILTSKRVKTGTHHILMINANDHRQAIMIKNLVKDYRRPLNPDAQELSVPYKVKILISNQAAIDGSKEKEAGYDKKVMQMLKYGLLDVVVQLRKLEEGYTNSLISVVLWCYRSKSAPLIYQNIMRGGGRLFVGRNRGQVGKWWAVYRANAQALPESPRDNQALVDEHDNVLDVMIPALFYKSMKKRLMCFYQGYGVRQVEHNSRPNDPVPPSGGPAEIQVLSEFGSTVELQGEGIDGTVIGTLNPQSIHDVEVDQNAYRQVLQNREQTLARLRSQMRPTCNQNMRDIRATVANLRSGLTDSHSELHTQINTRLDGLNATVEDVQRTVDGVPAELANLRDMQRQITEMMTAVYNLIGGQGQPSTGDIRRNGNEPDHSQ